MRVLSVDKHHKSAAGAVVVTARMMSSGSL